MLLCAYELPTTHLPPETPQMSASIPTIHSNGTSGTDLLGAIRAAHVAVAAAQEALAKTAPHGRDYYVQNPEAINEAIRQHQNRMRDMMAVGRELEEIWAGIFEQTT